MPSATGANFNFLATTLVLAAGVLFVDDAWAAGAAASQAPNCSEVSMLPATANVEERRLVCDIPSEFRFDVQAAEFDGHLLRILDLAAWRGTDALAEIHAFDKIPGDGGAGWLTLADASGVDVAFFTTVKGKAYAFAEARMDLDSLKISKARLLDPLRPASEREALQLKAKTLVLGQSFLRCNEKLNPIVIDADIEGKREIWVYIMSAWDNVSAPMGGHHKFRVSADGTKVLEHFSQTSVCINMRNEDLKRSVGFPISDIQSQTPTAIHVFLSLQYQKPIYVLTTRNDRMWKVDGLQVSLLDPKDEVYETMLKWKAGLPTGNSSKDLKK